MEDFITGKVHPQKKVEESKDVKNIIEEVKNSLATIERPKLSEETEYLKTLPKKARGGLTAKQLEKADKTILAGDVLQMEEGKQKKKLKQFVQQVEEAGEEEKKEKKKKVVIVQKP